VTNQIHRASDNEAARSNKGVTTLAAKFNSWARAVTPRQPRTMFTLPEIPFTRILRPQLAVVFAFAVLMVAFGGNVASADVKSKDIEPVIGTAVEVRPPSAIVIASDAGLVTLNFNTNSDLRIGSNKALVADVTEGDRVVSTAVRDEAGELVAVKTLVRVAKSPPVTKHVVGIVTGASTDELSIQTRNGDVVDVLVPAGIDAPLIGDGVTIVARLDRGSGILTAVGFELTSKTVERIQNARDQAKNQADSARLTQIAIDARSKHLSALDGAVRALKRVIESERVDQETLNRATVQFAEIQRRFNELKRIYDSAARGRNESVPVLNISGALVDEISSSSFTIVPEGEQAADPFSVDFVYDADSTTVVLPSDLLREISRSARNPQLLSDVRRLIDPGSELDVKYSISGNVRTAVSIRVRAPRLVAELEAVLEHESLRAFHGVITLVQEDDSLADALGIVIASNVSQGVKVAAKVTDETEITLDGESSDIGALAAGQAVDIQFESSEAGSLSEITTSDVTLRAIAIRARSSAPTDEDHISGIVESIDLEEPSITIRPTDGSLIELVVGEEASIVRNGRRSTLENVKIGDLVIDATRTDSDSNILTRLVVVAHKNVKFAGTVTGIGREPARIQVTGENGQSLNILITDETWVILDGQRVQFSAVATGMRIANGVYSVTGRGGNFYNVATIISIESPKVVRTSGTITRVNVVEGTLTVITGKSNKTQRIELKLPETPLGENLTKDGLPIRSLLEVERFDRADIIFYVPETGLVEKLSVVSDNFIQSRGTLIGISGNSRFAKVELINGQVFDLWLGGGSTLHLNGRRIQTFRPVSDLLGGVMGQGSNVSALVPEVLFFRDSIDSNLGVIISIQVQIKVESEDEIDDSEFVPTSLTVSGVIEAINDETWVIDGTVFTVNDSTRFIGDDAEIGMVAVAVLASTKDGIYRAKAISVTGRR
jgi:hypothetical protein